jgi:hypothetical protein
MRSPGECLFVYAGLHSRHTLPLGILCTCTGTYTSSGAQDCTGTRARIAQRSVLLLARRPGDDGSHQNRWASFDLQPRIVEMSLLKSSSATNGPSGTIKLKRRLAITIYSQFNSWTVVYDPIALTVAWNATVRVSLHFHVDVNGASPDTAAYLASRLTSTSIEDVSAKAYHARTREYPKRLTTHWNYNQKAMEIFRHGLHVVVARW